MSISKVYSAIPFGFTAKQVVIEGDTMRGLPSFNIVGMPSKSIAESRERIRSAIHNTGFIFPRDKIVINLAPAELQKNGTGLDLPIALAIMLLSRQILQRDAKDTMFAGELALNGDLRPIPGIINIIEYAAQNGYRRIFIPSQNQAEAELVADKIDVFPVTNLHELWQKLKQNGTIFPLRQIVKNTKTDKHKQQITFDQIQGQNQAKRALTIAIAGHHNMLLFGPPGSGKSMLAKAAASLLPPLSQSEKIDVVKLYSLASKTPPDDDSRPFCAPHHSISTNAFVGGSNGLPGEISLAHHGVLFMDEMPEFHRDALEALRQPLEDKYINICRAKYRYTLPTDFILIATMNPCPCGYLGSTQKTCSCSLSQIKNYRNKLSGPLLDRIDISMNIEPVNSSILIKNTTTSTQYSACAKQQIETALNKQFNRYHNSSTYNANLSSAAISEYIKLDDDAHNLLVLASEKLQLSTRSYFKTIKLAQTIADLDDSPNIQAKHLTEALSYRQTLPS